MVQIWKAKEIVALAAGLSWLRSSLFVLDGSDMESKSYRRTRNGAQLAASSCTIVPVGYQTVLPIEMDDEDDDRTNCVVAEK
jgi:hypothetical protein